VTCKKAQEFLAQIDCPVNTLVNARKEQFDRDAAQQLIQTVAHVIAVKGKKVLRFSMAKDPAITDYLLSAILGPSGNLRAPALRKGKTFVVGFRPDVYSEVLG